MKPDVIDLEKKRQERFERRMNDLLNEVNDPVQRKAIESLLKAYKLLGEALRK